MTAARNATVAVIGAGDYIGAAIARKFAAEGFAVFAGRRNGEKLSPLVAEIESRGEIEAHAISGSCAHYFANVDMRPSKRDSTFQPAMFP